MITAKARSNALSHLCPADCAVAPQPSTNQVTPKPGTPSTYGSPEYQFHPGRASPGSREASRVTARIHRS